MMGKHYQANVNYGKGKGSIFIVSEKTEFNTKKKKKKDWETAYWLEQLIKKMDISIPQR